MSTTTHLLGLLRASLRSRQRLVVENLALRHQIVVLKRGVKRARIEDSDRIFWILMRRTFKEWRDCLHFVKPDTVVKWHRRGWRYYWRRKSKAMRIGRPPIGWVLVHLIRRMSRENPLWGAPHITSELAIHLPG